MNDKHAFARENLLLLAQQADSLAFFLSVLMQSATSVFRKNMEELDVILCVKMKKIIYFGINTMALVKEVGKIIFISLEIK